MENNHSFYPVKRVNNRKNQTMIQNRFGEVEYLTFSGLSKIECINHLFSTKIGGKSEGIYATMNLSFGRGDSEEAVYENFDRIAGVFGVSREQFVLSQQTHTDHIHIVTKEDMGNGLTKPLPYTDIDGLITNEKGIILSTFYADCVPIFLVDPVHKAIGLCHSGWKGTVLQIGKKAIELMHKEYGTNPQDIHAAIAPSICQNCYEVSEDVILKIKEGFSYLDLSLNNPLFYKKENGKYQLNLWACCRQYLLSAGVLDENIEITDICTCCNPDYLFSHRASDGKRGNLGAFLMLK